MAMRTNVADHLRQLYPHLDTEAIDQLVTRVCEAAGVDPDATVAASHSPLPGADEVTLITYASTVSSADGGPHLHALTTFCRDHLDGVFSTVHVLPFFPASSDGGFAVVDYRQVAEDLGDWHDLAELAGSGSLMVDLVANHGSSQSEWFKQFQADQAPGRDYFVTADPDADLSLVTRPRTHPLLRPTETPAGERHVWATFSWDQVDFDFSNPDVLVEFASIIGFYLEQGADRIRLDAIAYLWKRIGTTSIHLPETHQVVKLMRLLAVARNPRALIITETNVPHAENISYFGDSDEAHVVYNFTLAPMIVWSLVIADASAITTWLRELVPAPAGTTFLNFLATHDGLGLRPVEDMIAFDDLRPMIDQAVSVGGDYSAYSTADGPRPYELNVSLADLLAGPNGETLERYLTAHALLMSLQGIPAIYMHSMLASPGDLEAVAATGAKRSINRSRVPIDEAIAAISSGWRAEVFARMSDLIRVRRRHKAFDPVSPQQVHQLHPKAVVVERGRDDTAIMAVHNMSGRDIELNIPAEFVAGASEPVELVDIITNEPVTPQLKLAPWQARWISRSASENQA